jgi:hypothetical protein
MSSAGGAGLYTALMRDRVTYQTAGWDLENTWWIDGGSDYPRLRCLDDFDLTAAKGWELYQ